MRLGVVQLVVCGIGMLQTFGPLCTSEAEEAYTAAELADANRSAVEAIHSLILEVETKSQPAGIDRKYRLTWSGNRKRCQLQDFDYEPIKPEFSHREFQTGFTDAYIGPDGYRALFNYDPLEAADLTVEIDHPAHGEISDVGSSSSSMNIVVQQEAHLLLGIPDTRGIVIPLTEFVSSATSCRVTKQPNDERRGGCFVLDAVFGKAEYQIQLSPDHNFMIEAIHCRNNGEKWSTQVGEFSPLGDGNYLGTSIESFLGAETRIVTKVKIISANSAISDEDFRVSFPRGLQVYDEAKGIFYVWGDGEPHLTFRTIEQLREWEARKKQAWATTHSSGTASRRRIIVGLTVVLGFASLLTYLRRRSSRPQNSSPTR